MREHPRRRPLASVVGTFLADCAARGLSPRTIEQYAWAIGSFRGFLGGDPASQVLAQLEPDGVRAWAAALRSHRAPASVASAVRALKVFGSWVAREQYASSDPLGRVRVPRVPDPLILPLERAQVARLMGAAPPTVRCAIAILVDTGLRAGELCGLRAEDVLDGQLRVREAKGGRERLVPYGRAVRSEIRAYVTRGRPWPIEAASEPLLVGARGHALTPHALGAALRRLGRRTHVAGVRVSPHTFRHTFAREFLLNGGGELALQRVLGHTSLDMVRRYARLTDVDIETIHETASPLDRWHGSRRPRPGHASGRPSSSSRRSSGERRDW